MNNNHALPPLPLIDGVLFIDNSAWVEGFETCHRLLQHKSLDLRIPAGEKASLNFGSATHLCLEHRYRKYGVSYAGPDLWNDWAKILSKFYNEHPTPVDDWRTINWNITLMSKYNERYEMEDFQLLTAKGELLVELPFALPLYTHCSDELGKVPVIYKGRIDLPIVIDGMNFVMDHKTTSMLGQSFFEKMKMSTQQKGYCWAFTQATGLPVTGYIINAIRTKEPPQYVRDMKPSKSGGKSLTPEQWWRETFQRERYILRPGELDEWKNNVIALCERFFFDYRRGYMPQSTQACTLYGRCPYYDVCTLPAEDRGLFLASGMFTDNTWSPLNAPTQSKQ